MPATITARIAAELAVRVQQVEATVELLDGGSTVPFIARYRKEVTGGLDDAQLRTLEERLTYLRELDARREAVLAEIRSQDKLTPELEAAIQAADTKAALEDLYLPYRPKRRTKAQIAREAGLEPLADLLLGAPGEGPRRPGGAVRRCREEGGRRRGSPGRGALDPGRALQRDGRSGGLARARRCGGAAASSPRCATARPPRA